MWEEPDFSFKTKVKLVSNIRSLLLFDSLGCLRWKASWWSVYPEICRVVQWQEAREDHKDLVWWELVRIHDQHTDIQEVVVQPGDEGHHHLQAVYTRGLYQLADIRMDNKYAGKKQDNTDSFCQRRGNLESIIFYLLSIWNCKRISVINENLLESLVINSRSGQKVLSNLACI